MCSFFINRIATSVRCPEHRHPFYEIVYMCDRGGYIEINGRRYEYRHGDIVVHPPEQAHIAFNKAAGEHHCLGVAGKEIALPFGIVHADETLANAFAAIAGEMNRRDRYHAFIIDALASQIIWTLKRRLDTGALPEGTSASEKIASVKEIIDRDYGSMDITLDMLSEKVLLDKDYIRHLFKKEYGTSPIRYLIGKKIEHSKTLLANRGMKVNEIAAATGFEDEYYFSRVFKKVTGKTPTQFRKAIL